MNLDKKLQSLFESIIDLEQIDRHPAVFIQIPGVNSVTLLPQENLNELKAGFMKTFTSDQNNKSSAVYRGGLGYLVAEQMINNRTLATQLFVLSLNNALIQLTDTLGTTVVTNKNNKISVKFLHFESIAAIEMQVKIEV